MCADRYMLAQVCELRACGPRSFCVQVVVIRGKAKKALYDPDSFLAVFVHTGYNYLLFVFSCPCCPLPGTGCSIARHVSRLSGSGPLVGGAVVLYRVQAAVSHDMFQGCLVVVPWWGGAGVPVLVNHLFPCL